MGERLATIDMDRKLRAVPLLGGAGSPSNTVWPGSRPTSTDDNFFPQLASTIQDLQNLSVGELFGEGFGGHSPPKWALNVNSENFKPPYLP